MISPPISHWRILNGITISDSNLPSVDKHESADFMSLSALEIDELDRTQ